MIFTKEKSELIRILSFFMTCFIVLYHTGIYNKPIAINVYDLNFDNFLSSFFDFMAIISISYFFIVSGFLLFNNLTFETYKRKILTRIHSLLIPYILWQLIFSILIILRGKHDFSLINFIKQTFLFLDWPLNPVMWYVYIIFIFAIFSPILLFLYRNKISAYMIVLITFITLSVDDIYVNPFSIKMTGRVAYLGNILFYLPSFLMGAFYGKFYNKIKAENSLIYVFLILVIALCINGMLGKTLLSSCLLLFPLILLLKLPTNRKLVNLSLYKLTFLIYVIQLPIIDVLSKFLSKFCAFPNFPTSILNISIRLICMLGVIVSSLIIHLLLNKVSPKFLNLLTGGRNGE